MKFVDNFQEGVLPVENTLFSTEWTHRATLLTESKRTVFPIIHTPYVLL